jgi:hypothetical protein
LVTGKRKDFRPVALHLVSPDRETLQQDDNGYVGIKALSGETVRLQVGQYLGHGIDEWVWTCLRSVQTCLASDVVRQATATHYWRSGLTKWFEFVRTTCPKLRTADLGPGDVLQFIHWLKAYPTFGGSSAKSAYANVKAVLLSLQEEGSIRFDGSLFPRNPFPGSNANMRGEVPLSEAEQGRVERALKADIVGIHRGTVRLSGLQTLCVYTAGLAARLGPNTTPLLELERVPLAQHPLQPSMRVLLFKKRRGNATHVRALRYSSEVDEHTGMRGDSVALYNLIYENAESLAAEAPKGIQNRLLLYRALRRGRGRQPGGVSALTPRTLLTGLQQLVERHQLTADDGTPLRLNLSRFRKSRAAYMDEEVGDVAKVAMANDHSVPVHESNYHFVTERMLGNAASAIENLTRVLRQTPIQRSERTPVSGCGDPLHGQHAPKDGKTKCADFLSCIGCRSFALVETEPDLHRFFSFYWHCVDNSVNHASDSWRLLFKNIASAIDAFAETQLRPALVQSAKDRARKSPVTFWRSNVGSR